MGDSYLPSNYLYLPLQVTFRGNINDASGTHNFHNIVGLHGEESIVFSTKERCPYLVTLEIVDVSQTDPAEDEVEGEDGSILRRGKKRGAKRRAGNASILFAANNFVYILIPPCGMCQHHYL